MVRDGEVVLSEVKAVMAGREKWLTIVGDA